MNVPDFRSSENENKFHGNKFNCAARKKMYLEMHSTKTLMGLK